VGMSAFSVFFTQSPSFLAHQRDMKLRKGRSNAESLFELRDWTLDKKTNTVSQKSGIHGVWIHKKKKPKMAEKVRELTRP